MTLLKTGLLAGAAFAWGAHPALTMDTAKGVETTEIKMPAPCSDQNRAFLENALNEIWGESAPLGGWADVYCETIPMNSDMFGLVVLGPEADVSGLKEAPPDDYQARMVDTAQGIFGTLLPDGLPPMVASGFTGGGAKNVVFMDYGAAGRFLYFQT